MLSRMKISPSAVALIDGAVILKQFYYPNYFALKNNDTRCGET
jgi:hypothetical protein